MLKVQCESGEHCRCLFVNRKMLAPVQVNFTNRWRATPVNSSARGVVGDNRRNCSKKEAWQPIAGSTLTTQADVHFLRAASRMFNQADGSRTTRWHLHEPIRTGGMIRLREILRNHHKRQAWKSVERRPSQDWKSNARLAA